jgi:hypothetical protein
MVSAQFSAFQNINEFGLLLRMGLASMLHHREWIEQYLCFNHVVKTSSICFRSRADLKRVTDGEWIKLVHPWSAPQQSFSGIPPYQSILQHVDEVRQEQRLL